MKVGSSPVSPKAVQPAIAQRLLTWYDRNARSLPWRARPGIRPDPYRVWLSEIMLQQTTVAAAGPYFQRFVARWPTVVDLAAAPLDDVLVAWAGLGYYARARNLHRCAQVVAAELGGRFPEDPAALRALPGIGAYTAGAIAAIAFDRPAAAVDGNVERVVARLFAVETPLPAAKPALRSLAEALVPSERAGDFAQAMMDLGATVCLPGRPKCLLCPLSELCSGLAAGRPELLPVKAPKAERPVRRGVAFWVTRPDGRILLRRRPAEGLLGGMTEVPSTPWRAEGWETGEAERHPPLPLRWRPLAGQVGHTFTHFHLELAVWAARASSSSLAGQWVSLDELADQALPSVMRKVIAHALKATAAPR